MPHGAQRRRLPEVPTSQGVSLPTAFWRYVVLDVDCCEAVLGLALRSPSPDTRRPTPSIWAETKSVSGKPAPTHQFADHELETTVNHPFWIRGEGWTRVGQIEPGSVVQGAFGDGLTVTRIEFTTRLERVYNFGVREFRSYFVGESGAWVHNCWEGGIQKAYDHFRRHGDDFADVENAKQYVDEARDFLQDPPDSAVDVIRQRDGSRVVYDPKTNRFAVEPTPNSGNPATYYKPDPAKHGEKSNEVYFLKDLLGIN